MIQHSTFSPVEIQFEPKKGVYYYETGRYMKPPLTVPERFCKICKNKVEDEKHFIFYCPLY
jgi:hypothetical protein